ncbi:DegV family protein [Alkalicoccus urumqiensis]|uniref:Fatty acid-binding protein DegV n=1 Tax=Alkalicoccus urumqiensis TaxID=1548213 RepID=A0A2P6MKS4_ALKUR|nr:DegV family protein [Alkalicoccus urumqiensis]PRO66878.1 fatty acid-binding protein DegV [Alkalicoccus urumqiensis]
MPKIHIVTDSTLDLEEHQIEKYGIHVVPLSVTVGGKTYVDRVEIDSASFIDKMKEADELPKSSQPSPGTFKELYDRLGEDGSEVISIHMASKLSGTYDSARQAAGMSEASVTVVDSEYISTALGFQVVEAARLAEQGASMEEITAKVQKVKENTRLYIMVDTLENLVKGGRIGRGRAFVGSLLKIKPLAVLDGGEYTPAAKVRTHSQMIKWMTDTLREEAGAGIVKGAGIAHAGALQLSERLAESVKQVRDIPVSIIGTTPIISTHTGPGALAFMFYTEEEE